MDMKKVFPRGRSVWTIGGGSTRANMLSHLLIRGVIGGHMYGLCIPQSMAARFIILGPQSLVETGWGCKNELSQV